MKKIIQMMICISFMFIIGSKISQASELNFSVNPVIPENQQDKDKTYFDIKLDANQKQVLKVLLKNDTDKEVVVETELNRATTNLNGVVEYGKTKDKKDTSVQHDIEEYIEVTDKEVTIPPMNEKEITLKVTAPSEEFEGIMAGGLTFKEKMVNESNDNEESGLAIENEYAYVVGIVMHGNQEPVPALVKLLNVKAAQVNARNVINANLQNPQPQYLSNMSVEAKITQKNSENVLYQARNEDMQMAPNSNFNYPISLEGKPLKAGDYRLSMKVVSGENSWIFTKDFSIAKKVADSYNAKDVSIEKNNLLLYLIIGIGFLIIVGLLIFLIFKRNKKDEPSNDEKTN